MLNLRVILRELWAKTVKIGAYYRVRSAFRNILQSSRYGIGFTVRFGLRAVSQRVREET